MIQIDFLNEDLQKWIRNGLEVNISMYYTSIERVHLYLGTMSRYVARVQPVVHLMPHSSKRLKVPYPLSSRYKSIVQGPLHVTDR